MSFKNDVHKQVINEAIKALYCNINNIQIFWFYRDFVYVVEWRTFHITYTLKAFISGCGPVLPLHFSRRKLTFHYTVTVHLIVPLTNLQLADGNLYFADYFNHQATERVKAKALRWQIIMKIELHFPVGLFFFKAEEMLVIDFYRNESLFQHINVVSTR